MNSKVTVKKESKVTITIDGKEYVYTEDEARSLHEGLTNIFATDKSPSPLEELQKHINEGLTNIFATDKSPSPLEELQKDINRYRETYDQKYKKYYGDWCDIQPNPPWKQPGIWY
jgi:hypothetical protein